MRQSVISWGSLSHINNNPLIYGCDVEGIISQLGTTDLIIKGCTEIAIGFYFAMYTLVLYIKNVC